MANGLLSPDQDQDERLNRGQEDYNERFNAIAKAEESATFNDIVKDNDLGSAEANASDSDNPMNYTGGSGNKPGVSRSQKVLGFAKKRGGIVGLLIALLLGGGVLTTVMSPFGMIFSLMENISINNDSSSTAMERRFLKVFGNMTNPDNDAFCANSTKNIKCRMGRISNKALHSLQKKGVTAIHADGSEFDGTKKGYPDKNPARYRFDMPDGTSRVVNAADLTGFLAQKENRKFAAKILGTGGAFNVKVKAWTGKHISKKLYKKFNLSRDGGLADGKNGGRKTAIQRLNESMEKVREKIPGMESADKIASGITEKASKHLGKAQKGGAAYVTAVAGCVAVRAPGYIASGVAAIQLAQVMPFFLEYIGGPASKAKQTTIGSGFTGEDMDAVGTVLTEKIDGKSALDSQVLLASAGVNTEKTKIPKDVTPGFSILTNDIVKYSGDLADSSEEACNAIMSPTAMYTAMAADIALTAATSATVVGGIIKIVASLAVSTIATEVTKAVLKDTAKAAITDIATNDAIPKAKGEQLGDVIGVSSQAFFATGGLSRNLSVLTESQLVAFNEMTNESQQFQKEMDIASLSPFDTSSRHTFLGSIVYSMRTAALANGGFSSAPSLLSTLAAFPLSLASNTANASTSINYGSYAKQFGVATDSPMSTPCITVSGLPCTGLTTGQASISTAQAIKYMEDEGWIEDITASEDAIVDDLIGKGIKEDTLLSEFIETCSNPEEGNYLFSAAGCTVPDQVGTGYSDVTNQATFETEDGESVNVSDMEGVSNQAKPVSSVSAFEAITPFLLDYQIVQSINGEDEEKEEAKTQATGEFIHYRQTDERWADYPFAGTVVGPNGCGPTSMAIILANLIDPSITPPDVVDNGGTGHPGYTMYQPMISGVLAKWGDKVSITQASSVDDAFEFIKSGKGMVWAGGGNNLPFTQGGHMVALVGVTENDEFIVADPWGGMKGDYGMHEDIANYPRSAIASGVNSGIFKVEKK